MNIRVRAIGSYLVLGLILILSLAIRFYDIGKQSYWIDEMVSLNIAKTGGWRAFTWDNSPFLYHAILEYWVRFFGDNEMVVRSLSALASGATTAILMRLGWVLAGWPGVIVAGVSHAGCSLSVRMAQEARMYSLFELMAALNLFYFYLFFKKGLRGLYYLATIPLLCFVHYLAAVPLFIESFWLIRGGKSRQSVLYGWTMLAILFLISLVVGSLAIRYSYLNWQALKFQVDPLSRWPSEISALLSNGSPIVSAVLIFLLGAALIRIVKVEKSIIGSDLLLFLSFVILPVLVASFAGWILKRATLVPRYYVFIVPAFVGFVTVAVQKLASEGFSRRQTRDLVYVIIAALWVVGSAVSFTDNYKYRKAPWRETAKTIYEDGGRLVLTDKTTALRVPYFEELGIELLQWPNLEHSLEFLAGHLERSKTVWVIEDYWGGHEYLPRLKKQLDDQGYKTRDHVFTIEGSPPVLALYVQNPN